MSRLLRDYRAYGLWVRSPIPLPFVPVPVPPTGEPDVTVRIGATPEALPAPADKCGLWEAAPGAFLMDVPGVARYLVTDGRDLLVEPHGGSDHGAGVFLTGLMFSASGGCASTRTASGACAGSGSSRRTSAPSPRW